MPDIHFCDYELCRDPYGASRYFRVLDVEEDDEREFCEACLRVFVFEEDPNEIP